MVSKTRDRLREFLNNYQTIYKGEVEFKKRMISLLSFPNCFDRSLLHAHFTASVWVVNESFDEAILTHHAKLDRWLQLGGHADGDENLLRVAKKELNEESGLTRVQAYFDRIFDIDIHTIPERKGVPQHEHYDVRFLFVADKEEEINFNHESKNVAWVPLTSIAQLCNGNDSILRMIEKTEQIRREMSVRH